MIPTSYEPGEDGTDSSGNLRKIFTGVFLCECPSGFSAWTQDLLRAHNYSHIIYIDRIAGDEGPELDRNEFECLDLNFRDSLVLRLLYASEKFLAKALNNDGKVLILETEGNERCMTVILGYLMCHYGLCLRDAFYKLRTTYRSHIDLDPFLIMQLCEYEPIVEVQRTVSSGGHSSSGESLRSVLKRTRTAETESVKSLLTTIHLENNDTTIHDEVAME